MIEVTVLGSGTSQGIPIIGCNCEVCSSTDPHDKRLRSSIMIETRGKRFVIDAGPDFRYQMLRENVRHIDAIILTHYHKDHIGGIDDVRAFNYVMHKPIHIYGEEQCLNVVRKDFDYAFAKEKYPGVPEITLHTIIQEPFEIDGIRIVPIRGMHCKMPVLGYRIDNFCYLTDMNYISDTEISKIKGVDTLIINALRHEKHISHFSLEEALQQIQKIGAKENYLTHISHQLGKYEELRKQLPEGVFPAYDKLKLIIK